MSIKLSVEQPLSVAVASSLIELFAPSIHRERIADMRESYPFVIDTVGLLQAPCDAEFALDQVKGNARAASRRLAWPSCGSSVTLCGRSWMRCLTPTSIRA
jgi:pyrroloquinoline quinone (PQQ) biosynthesis protein C